MSRTSARTQARRRLLAAIVAFGMAVGLFAAPAPERTEANWVDSEHVASGELTALRLQPPIIVNATCSGGLLGLLFSSFVVNWQMPISARSEHANVVSIWSFAGNVLTTQPDTVKLDEIGNYRTTFSSNLLTNLANLLGTGGTFHVSTAVVSNTGHRWTSQRHSEIRLRTGLLGIGVRCNEILNGI